MESRLIADSLVAAFDPSVVAGLDLYTVHQWSIQPKMQIALRNESRSIYRTIGVDGMVRWMNALDWFIERGFVDEIGPYGERWGNYDAIFTRRR